jgi:outer membrane lipoprotein LolB
MRRCARIAVLPLLLAGCASLSPSGGNGMTQSTAAQPYRDAIDLSGRLSVRYQNNGKEEALHGSFIWTQNPARTSVTLLSPLGQTLAIIDVTPAGATLSQAGQPVRAAADADALAAGTLGWPLPVAGLRDWLQGYAVDANGSRFIASPQTTDVATRDGWRIRYAGWQDESPNRPKRIDLERSTAQAGDVFIRIVIDKWQ